MEKEIKNKHIEKIALEYQERIDEKDIILEELKKQKRSARRNNNSEKMNFIRKDEIHHSAERQTYVQFLSDLESIDIAIDEE